MPPTARSSVMRRAHRRRPARRATTANPDKVHPTVRRTAILGQMLHAREMSNHERRIVDAILAKTVISRDVREEMAERRTFGERMSDRIAGFGGSWTFILCCLGFLTVWIVINAAVLPARGEAFDPFPFILLNLGLSMLAALQAPVILMSQNRQSAHDRVEAAHDYEVNLKSELEIRQLHDKMDALREQQWAELVSQQQQQIAMLERLLAAHLQTEATK